MNLKLTLRETVNLHVADHNDGKVQGVTWRGQTKEGKKKAFEGREAIGRKRGGESLRLGGGA